MSDASFHRKSTAPDQRIPNALLKGILAVVIFTLVLVSGARLLGLQPAATPDDSVGVVQERMIRVDGNLGSAAKVWDADTGDLIADLDPEQAGFINGVMTALARERMLSKIDGNPPVRIVLFADGRLGLRDDLTGWRVELMGFGDTNRDAFLALLN
jgi:putative photosynthetic complex assembly protein